MGSWSTLDWIMVVGVVATVISVPAGFGFFRYRKRTIKELLYIEQERDNFRKRNAEQFTRLSAIDPERFIDRINDLRHKGDFA